MRPESMSRLRQAMAIDSLIRELPNDPYFYELRGQALAVASAVLGATVFRAPIAAAAR